MYRSLSMFDSRDMIRVVQLRRRSNIGNSPNKTIIVKSIHFGFTIKIKYKRSKYFNNKSN